MENGKEFSPKKQQFIDCGAAVRLDDAVVEHGVIFVHPEYPPLRLMFKFDPEGKKLPKYFMEPIKPEFGEQTQFAIRVHEVGQRILTPQHNEFEEVARRLNAKKDKSNGA